MFITDDAFKIDSKKRKASLIKCRYFYTKMITKRKFTFPTSTLLVGSLWNGKFSSEGIVRRGVCESNMAEDDAEDYNRHKEVRLIRRQLNRRQNLDNVSSILWRFHSESRMPRQSYNKRGYVDAAYNVACDNGKHPSCACVSTGEGKSPPHASNALLSL